jgi:hypothetical protein
MSESNPFTAVEKAREKFKQWVGIDGDIPADELYAS